MAGSAPVPRYSFDAGGPPPARPRSSASGGSRRRLLLVSALSLAIVLAGGTVAWAMTQRDPDGVEGQGNNPPATDPAGDPDGEGNQPQPPPPPPSQEQVPPDEQCTDEIRSNERWVCLTSATLTGGQLVLEYDVEWAGSIPDTRAGFHLHIYGSDGTHPSDHLMGTQAGDERGSWKIRDESPAVLDADDISDVIGDYPKVCARIANSDHALVQDVNGGYYTGNCMTIQS